MTAPATPLDFPALWARALTFEQVLAGADERYRPLWEGIYRNATAPAWAAAAVPHGTALRLIMLTEDWCMDTSNVGPFVARLAEAVPGVELRFLLRDQHPEVMDRYLTNGARAIPVVIVLDGAFRPLGHWGPRPSELQAWVMAHKDSMPKEERLRETRKWYARDRGASAIREILAVAGIAVPAAA
ncbi:MAG: thioredoxin family protein [Gemmatimonadales bacterium]|nr:thioredoxin family protein [Gemmatimonadales bacterium]